MKRNVLVFIFMVVALLSAKAQVTIGSGLEPRAGSLLDLKEDDNGKSTKGLLLPRVELVSEDLASPLLEHIQGMYVYNLTQNGDVQPGVYFNNGTKWQLVNDAESGPWRNTTTHLGAKDVQEDMYHLGAIGMGDGSIDPSAQVDIASSSKGVLIPRMSKDSRNAMTAPANGLIIFNTSSGCLNYYNEPVGKWLSMCGTYDPASFELFSCTAPVGPQGTYTQGTGLSTVNTYTIILSTSEIGTYDIRATTGNGYIFSKSGVFSTTGTHQVVLEGQGVPLVEGTDAVSLVFNGIAVTPSCTLPTITVAAASTRYAINCGSTVIHGTYLTNYSLVPSTNYIEVGITVTTAGQTQIETTQIDGMKFSSGSINVALGAQTVKLYGQGKPEKAGTSIGYQFTVDATTCTFDIPVTSTLGTFEFPANRCQDILDELSTSPDGYYWVKEAGTNKFKTYCDMELGGAWTLVKSLSERQILVTDRTQNESIATQGARSSVTTKEGKFNEYNFALTSATVNNIGSSVGVKKFRFTIKEKGHTTAAAATYTDIESSTVSPNNDVWTQDNYWNVTITAGNPAISNFLANTYTAEGKLFGKPWGKPVTGATNTFFDGVAFAIDPPGMYSYGGFFTGFYGGLGYVTNSNAANNVTYTYHGRGDANDGKTFVYNKYYINDLFGLYMNSEVQLNHHIGTCSNSTDDFGGAASCAAGWANWRAHNFNQRPDSNYEGRIVQYWVK